MRLSIKLKAFRSDLLPANYNYPITAIVYNLLKLGSAEFAEFLHNKGYASEGKNFKLFTFALRIEKYRYENDSIRLLSPYITLLVSSPLDKEFVKNFIIGTLEKQMVKIRYDGYFSTFEIIQMETVPEPAFYTNMKFKLLSPIILSTKIETDGKTRQHYFRYYDDMHEINRVFNKNLERKYEALHKNKYVGKGIKLNWDNEYINRATDEKKITRLIRIKAKDVPEVSYKGNLLPFYLEGDIELIKIGYQCGFGEKNSMGFGMAEVIN